MFILTLFVATQLFFLLPHFSSPMLSSCSAYLFVSFTRRSIISLVIKCWKNLSGQDSVLSDPGGNVKPGDPGGNVKPGDPGGNVKPGVPQLTNLNVTE